jgi:uronate dehydrogenase
VQEIRTGNLASPGAPELTAAAEGMDTIVHLAATPDVADFVTELVPNNVVGLYHMFEAARTQGVKRVVVASTLRVVSGRVRDQRVVSVDEVAPRELYSVTKCLAEDMGRMYAGRYELSVIAARIGWLVRNATELARFSAMPAERQQTDLLSQDDAGRFFTKAVEAEGVKFAVLYAVSRRTFTAGLDLEPAKRLIGYEPQDVAPQGIHFD